MFYCLTYVFSFREKFAVTGLPRDKLTTAIISDKNIKNI